MKKVIMSWSGGKDSALALASILKDPTYKVISLFTTITEGYERISMHGVRIELLEEQALSIGIPLIKVYIPKECSNKDYEQIMLSQLKEVLKTGVDTFVFGDLFLEEIRAYRESQLAKLKMKAIFPLWGRPTLELANEFIHKKFKTIITCVDTFQLNKSFAGEIFDTNFLKKLPSKVDPCGENGEFHSFCFDGPIFNYPIKFKKGEKVLRNSRFMYCDLLV